MNIDTNQIRKFYGGYSLVGVKADIFEMCEEIDGLQRDVARLHDTNRALASSNVQLRDQVRPRPIKDEPPPVDTDLWIHFGYGWQPGRFPCADKVKEQIRITGTTHWMLAPPDPPAPDKFEEFYEKANAQTVERGRMINKDDARLFWDAAKKDQP